MKAEDKAKELIIKFHKHTWNGEDNLDFSNAKQCALICVNEMIKTIIEYQEFYGVGCLSIDELQQVKQEINKQ